MWLLYPGQEPKEDGTMGSPEWNVARMSSAGGSLVERASRKVVADGARHELISGDAGGTFVPPEPPVALSRRFYGVVEIDPVRLGGSAGQIGQEVVQHLVSFMGANVEVTLEIKADILEGLPEHVERIVSENCRTLKFRDFGLEGE
jgi:hypothetical protein